MPSRRATLRSGGAALAALAGCSYSSGPDAGLSADRVRWRAELDEPPVGLFRAGDLLLAPSRFVARGLSLADGSEAWRRQVDEPTMDGPRRYGRAAAAGAEHLYLAGRQGVLALGAADGALSWAPPGTEDVTRGPGGAKALSAAGGRVLAATPDAVVALDGATGAERWRAPLDAPDDLPALAATESEVAVTARASPTVRLLDAATGAERWTASVPAVESGSEVRPPAVADDTVYVATGRPRTERGSLRALARADGAERWRAQTDRVGRGTGPAVGPSRVYVGCDGTETGTLVCHGRGDGSRLWTVPGADDGVSAPAATARGAYVGGNGDRLRAVAPDGSVRWVVGAGVPVSGPPLVAAGAVHASALDTVFAAAA
ncbi:MAG: PQQ-binding-like beta-propeller repeat protein [Haloferacaceae archaeon]